MISVQNLSKRYGSFTAVDNVSFEVQSGRVTGFLGPNGSGKSTTLRMVVGLTPASAGSATVLGVPYSKLKNPGREVGVLLDAAAQHPGRTGREVLSLGCTTMGLPQSRVKEILQVVGLTEEESQRRIGNYSLGMRQRLGIGHALLGDPQVLILDEPANGLDPAGIRWMRDLLRAFAARGGAVVLSSHLLHEVEMIADDLVVIGRGKVIAAGTKEELLQASGTKVSSLDDDALATTLQARGVAVTVAPAGLHVEAEPATVGQAALDAHVVLTELGSAESQGLEELFLGMTAADARETV